MMFLAVFSLLASIKISFAAPLPALNRAEALDFRIEVGGEKYLLRITHQSLERLSEAIALGQPLAAADAMVVREDRYPPSVSRRVPPELARRATALWRLVEDRGWQKSAGIEWDPALAQAAPAAGGPSANPEGLRDAPADPGSRAGVWTVPSAGVAREQPASGVRCVEPLSGPSRCFRVWQASRLQPAVKNVKNR